MQQFWVPASKARSIVGPEAGGEYGAAIAICKRAHAGLLKSKASLFIIDKRRVEQTSIPPEFWWAEGFEALDQDWALGDFGTWIDQKIQMRAFGVQFDFGGLREMLSQESAAAAARSLSVANDQAWLSAKAARRFMYETLGSNPVTAGGELIEQCKLGFVAARAVLMQRAETSQRLSEAGQREWDIPEWFWFNFTSREASAQDWDRGVFSGKGRSPEGVFYMTLSGVYFERGSLEALAAPNEVSAVEAPNRGGRPRKEWWDDLWCAVWGQAYRGDLKPKNQAEIERAMMAWIEERGEGASESTVKPLARKMFFEMQR